MSLELSAHQRNLLFDLAHSRLTGLDEVWGAVSVQDWKAADRAAREFQDLLLVLVDDLGWGWEHEGPVQLTSPPQVLRRVLEALKREAAVEGRDEKEKRLEIAQAQLDREDAIQTCDELLAQLDHALEGEAAKL